MASTSSGSVTTSTVNGTSRITGLSSGLDVDSIVKGLMDAEKVKLNKMEQQEDLLTWRQEAYRNTMGTMNTFSSSYLDSLSTSSITKQGNFLQYDTESSDTAYVTASAGADAKVGSHTVAVSQLATASTRSSGAAVSKGVQGGVAPTYGFTSGTTWKMYVDEKLYSVDLSSVTDQTSLQTAVDKAVGSGKVTVGTNAGCLTLTSATAGVQYISVETQNLLGFTTAGVLANRITTGQTLSNINSSLNSPIVFSSDEISFTINGENFTFDKDDTLSAVMSTVNKSDAGVTMSYD